MRHLPVIVLALVLSSIMHRASAQSDSLYIPDSAAVIAYWNLGDKKTFLHTSTQYVDSGGYIYDFTTTSSLVSFEVIDSTFNTYTLRYGVDSILSVPDSYGNNEKFGLSLFEQIRYEYATDTYGEFLYMVNTDEVREPLKNAIRDMEFPQYSMAETERVRQELLDLYDREGQLELFLQQEIGMFHIYNGYTLPLYQEIEYETEYPNFLNFDVPVTAQGMTEVTVTGQGYALRFETFETIDSEQNNQDLKSLLGQYLNEQENTASGMESNDYLNALNVSLKDKTTVVYDFPSGWFTEGYFERVLHVINENENYKEYDVTRFQLLNR